jgi:hypothetical protein
MEAHHIDRFGSVDGIVLRSSEDPRPGPKEIPMRVRASSAAATRHTRSSNGKRGANGAGR